MKTLIAGCALLAASAWGHHSFSAEFDAKKVMTVSGVITKFEWMNPHSYFYVDAPDTSGKIVNWAIESRNLSIMSRQGWTRNTLKPGEAVTVTFYHHKEDAKNIGWAQTLTKADGTKYVIMMIPQ